MSEPVIRIHELSKVYRIGGEAERYRTLREAIVSRVAPSAKRLRGGAQRQQERNRTIRALSNVSFDVEGGGVVGIIGRNGAGKSTLLKVLSRITQPTSGSVELTGRVGSLLEVGTGFHPELTGRENIFLNGAIMGMSRAEMRSKFDEIVGFAEVEQFLDTPVKRYSSGMYMRLAFAVAAHLDPEILVVDEVLAVGDAEFQKKCLGRMKDVARHGRTVLFVSHNLPAVEQLCSRAILLDRGEVKRDDTDVRAVLKEYLVCGADATGGSEWRNSGDEFQNPYFHPIRFWVSGSDGTPLVGSARNDDSIFVNIAARIEMLDPSLTVGYAIYNDEGQPLYWSYQTDTAATQWPQLQRGEATLTTEIPKRFLNEGTYRLDLAGGLHCRKWLFEPGVHTPSVFLTIKGGLSDSPLWRGRRPGSLAPVLGWRVGGEPAVPRA